MKLPDLRIECDLCYACGAESTVYVIECMRYVYTKRQWVCDECWAVTCYQDDPFLLAADVFDTDMAQDKFLSALTKHRLTK
jgi:hypothetical protein